MAVTFKPNSNQNLQQDILSYRKFVKERLHKMDKKLDLFMSNMIEVRSQKSTAAENGFIRSFGNKNRVERPTLSGTKGARGLFRDPNHAERERIKRHEEEDGTWRKIDFKENEGEQVENEKRKEFKHHKIEFPSFSESDDARNWDKECEETNYEKAPIYDDYDEYKGALIFDDVSSEQWQTDIIKGQLVSSKEDEVNRAQRTKEIQWQGDADQKLKQSCSSTFAKNDGTFHDGTLVYDEEPQQGTNPINDDYVEHEETPVYDCPPTYDEPPQREGDCAFDDKTKFTDKIQQDEWKNFLARIGHDENTHRSELHSPNDILELRYWASYHGQTLDRTVRGMMYYREALILQTYLEGKISEDVVAAVSRNEASDAQGFDLSPKARAQVDLKFTYVVTCQICGKQKEEQKTEAAGIALFEGKVVRGNGEQVLSTDVYRLGQILDFCQMMSFYYTTVSLLFLYHVSCIHLSLWEVIFGSIWCWCIFSRGCISNKYSASDAAINTQFLFQIGLFTAVPMILGFILEQGFLRAIDSFVTMQFQPCIVSFTFSLGTRTHYIRQMLLHGVAKYHATGRGFLVGHIKFSGNYRLYFCSHFVKGWEVVLLLIVCLAYGNEDGSALAYILFTVSS